MHSVFVFPEVLYSFQFLLITAVAFANSARLVAVSSAALSIKLWYSSSERSANFASSSSRISSAVSVFPFSRASEISSGVV